MIPIDEELLAECLEVEQRFIAELSPSQMKEKEESIRQMEKIYEVYCKRYGKQNECWIQYILFERSYSRYSQAQKIYQRAIHQVEDLPSFEEKYNLLQVQSHL